MVSLWISFGRVAKEVVIPNGVVCREESAVAGGVLTAGKKQIPPLRVRNDNKLRRRIHAAGRFGVAHWNACIG